MKYVCSVCGLENYSENEKEIPMCCGEKMLPCTKAQDAEMARLTDEDGPCDDGTGHNR